MKGRLNNIFMLRGKLIWETRDTLHNGRYNENNPISYVKIKLFAQKFMVYGLLIFSE